MRNAVVVVILFALFASGLSLSASAQSQHTFYLHDHYLLDENAPTQTAPKSIGLSGQLRYFNWTTTAFSSDESFPAGNWNVILWMDVIAAQAQYRVRLGVHNQSGDFELSHAYTPPINTTSPTEYEVTMALSAFTIRKGGSLILGLLRQLPDGAASLAAFIFFDSVSTASGVNGPVATATITTITTTQQTTTTSTGQQATTTSTSQQATTTSTTSSTTTTTTQHLTTSTTQLTTASTTQVGLALGAGFAFAVVAIGVGVALAAGGLAAAATGRPYYSEVFAYAGYYYCRRHRVPVWYVQGRPWCPVEQRPLRP